MEVIAACYSILYDTAQGILLVLLCGTDGILRKVKLPVVLVPGLNSFFFYFGSNSKRSKNSHRKERVVPRPLPI